MFDKYNDIHELISYGLWDIIISRDSPQKKLQRMIEEIAVFFNVEKCSLMVKGKDGNFYIAAAKGLPLRIIKTTKVHEGEGNSGLAIKEKVAIFMKKIELTKEKHAERYKTDSFISHPIEDNGEIIGVLNLTDKKDNIYLSEKDLEAISPIIERLKFVMKQI